MHSEALPPPETVLTAFDAVLPLEHLPGGQGNTWCAGNKIFKPLDMMLEGLHWQADILAPLAGGVGLRLSSPLRAKDGSLVVEGWTSWCFLDGSTEHTGRWDEIIDAGNRFCELTKDVARPSFLNTRHDPWAVSDRIAWEEESAKQVLQVRFVKFLLDTLNQRLPWDGYSEPRQLIHGDLTGNVLFSSHQPPAIIDISPYWRPKSYATAIVVVDALTWEDAPPGWARGYLKDMRRKQAFVRALLFRILSDYFRSPTEPISDAFERPMKLVYQMTAPSDGT